MQEVECHLCGYIYTPEKGDPQNGIAPGTAVEDLPADWYCPACGSGLDIFYGEQTETA